MSHEVGMSQVTPSLLYARSLLPKLAEEVLSGEGYTHYDGMCVVARLARVLHDAETAAIGWGHTCQYSLYDYTKLLAKQLDSIDAVGKYHRAYLLRQVIADLWDRAGITECPVCHKPDWECGGESDHEEDEEEEESEEWPSDEEDSED